MKQTSMMYAIILLISIVMAGCSNGSDASSKQTNDTVQVYATIFPLADFAKKIGGDYVTVETVYPAGADSHTYEPTQKQTVSIAKADLFVYNGAELEPFAEKLEETLQNETVKIVNTSEGLDLLKPSEEEHEEHAEDGHTEDGHAEEEHTEDGHAEEEHAHNVDPHIWLDPTLAAKQAEHIKNALVELAPDHKEEFEKNFASLQKQFTDLDNEFKELVQTAKTKELLVSHAAYGYWEHRYGMEQIAVAGLSSSDEPSQKKLVEIAETAKEHQMKYILFETFATPKVAEVIQKETGTTVLRLHHMATVSNEDLKANKDYFALMKENMEVLRTAMNE